MYTDKRQKLKRRVRSTIRTLYHTTKTAKIKRWHNSEAHSHYVNASSGTKSNLVNFSLKIWHLVATILIIFLRIRTKFRAFRDSGRDSVAIDDERVPRGHWGVEHSDSRFESIHRFILSESIRIDSFCKNRPFDSLVVLQFFLAYLLQSPLKVIYTIIIQ